MSRGSKEFILVNDPLNPGLVLVEVARRNGVRVSLDWRNRGFDHIKNIIPGCVSVEPSRWKDRHYLDLLMHSAVFGVLNHAYSGIMSWKTEHVFNGDPETLKRIKVWNLQNLAAGRSRPYSSPSEIDFTMRKESAAQQEAFILLGNNELAVDRPFLEAVTEKLIQQYPPTMTDFSGVILYDNLY